MKNIKTIFTSEDMTEMKAAMKQIVIDQFKTELEQLDVYLFDPDAVNDLIQETYQEVLKELKVELKNKLEEKMLKDLNRKLSKI